MPSPSQSIPPWPKEETQPPALGRDMDADVCVIGGGIAGLTTAYLLAAEGRNVVLLEQDTICGGETGRTTAHLSPVLGTRYKDLAKIHGKDGSKLIAESHSAAIDEIERIAKEENIGCSFERLSGYLFLHEDDKENLLKDELDAVRDAGMNDVSLLPSLPPGSFSDAPALHFPNQGQIDPAAYMHGLLLAARKKGVHIHAHSRATEFKNKDGRWKIKTDGGHTVRSQAVVIATMAPVYDNVKIFGKQAAYRTYAIAIPNLPGALQKALYWDTHDPYHYIRIQPGEKHDLLIVGGEDHKTGQENDGLKRFAALERWTKARFPDTGEPSHRWSGQVMETADGIAMIGKFPGNEEGLFIVTGDCGNGLTHATLGAMLLRDMIMGKSNPWQDLYDPSRIRPTKELLTENMNVAKEMAGEWLCKTPDLSPIHPGPGHGVVVEHEKKKIALYRDKVGGLHACSAVCPHKGCIVRWNSSEQSWDCPCHGSRFSTDGKVLDGPSMEDLEPVDAAGLVSS